MRHACDGLVFFSECWSYVQVSSLTSSLCPSVSYKTFMMWHNISRWLTFSEYRSELYALCGFCPVIFFWRRETS